MGPIPNGITNQNKGNKCSFFFIINCRTSEIVTATCAACNFPKWSWNKWKNTKLVFNDAERKNFVIRTCYHENHHLIKGVVFLLFLKHKFQTFNSFIYLKVPYWVPSSVLFSHCVTFSNKDTNRTGSLHRPCSSFINTRSGTESPVSLVSAFHLISFHSDRKPFSGSDIN